MENKCYSSRCVYSAAVVHLTVDGFVTATGAPALKSYKTSERQSITPFFFFFFHYPNPDACGAGMNPILHATLPKSHPKWCQAGSSLNSCKLKWFSAAETDIPPSQTGSLPSSTVDFRRLITH